MHNFDLKQKKKHFVAQGATYRQRSVFKTRVLQVKFQTLFSASHHCEYRTLRVDISLISNMDARSVSYLVAYDDRRDKPSISAYWLHLLGK